MGSKPYFVATYVFVSNKDFFKTKRFTSYSNKKQKHPKIVFGKLCRSTIRLII